MTGIFKLRNLAIVAGIIILLGVAFLFWVGGRNNIAKPQPLESYNASAEAGRYLAVAGNCQTCHTAPGGAAFAGGLRFETPFGTMYSTNISQDEATGIGSWSFEDFHKAMRVGVRPDGAHLYPAFPYPSFAKLTDEDIASLYLYMKTLEPVPADAPANALNFPFNMRFLLSFWNAFHLDKSVFQADASQSEQWNRGAYLIQGLGHCGACHTPRNGMGAEIADLALTGGVNIDKVKTGEYRKWSSPNLTPHPTGLASWGEEDIVAYLKTGHSERAVTHGPMNEVVMNSTRYMSDEDLQAMAAYLKGAPAKAQDRGPAADQQTMGLGETGFTVHCGTCHLPTGLGAPDLGAPLAGNAVVQAPDPATMINVILYGPDLPEPPFVSGRRRMDPFGDKLSDEEIADIASYVRATWGNDAGRVTPEQVAKQR